MKAIKVTKIALFIAATIALIYDVVIVIIEPAATISKVTLWAGIRLAIVPYAWGVLTSHFWLGKIGRKLFGLGKWRFFVWIPISVGVLMLSLFGPMKLITWTSNNVWSPLFLGLLLGLFWAQKRPKSILDDATNGRR